MTTKKDYTPDEWQLLLDVPPLVGSAVMVAGRSGLGSMKEAFALASSVLGGKQGHESNELIAALIDARLKEGDRSGVEQLKNPYSGQSPDELRGIVLEKCRQVVELLLTKSQSPESDQYRQWAVAVGYQVAQAAKEGGFLGIGGERVSQPEREVLQAVAQVLDVPSPV